RIRRQPGGPAYHRPPRGAALPAHLAADPAAAGDHHGSVLRHLRQSDRPADRRHGRFHLHGVHRPGADHDVGDHQQLRQRGVELLRQQVPAQRRGAAGVAGIAAHHPHRLRRRGRAARAGGGRDRHHAVAVLHPPAGASPRRDRAGGAADGDHLLPRWLRQCGVRTQLRRHLDHSDLRADAADLSGRGVLFHHPVAAVLAGGLAGQPDPAHGQCLPLRHPRGVRHPHRRGHRLHAAGHRSALHAVHPPAGQWSRDASVKPVRVCGWSS
ncbi:UNVERIFIED_CONTAM: hypothetical protein NCL1_61689, partial [Trichonephila clavipes]